MKYSLKSLIEDLQKIPNILTILRFCITFWLAVTTLIQPEQLSYLQGWALAFFLVGCLTDWGDGKIARAWPSQKSRLGEWIDPIADKALVISYMAYLSRLGLAASWYEYFCFACIIAREIGMLIRRWAGGLSLLPVNQWGKWKTAFQMFALAIYGGTGFLPSFYPLAAMMLFIATAFTLWSLKVYLFPSAPRVMTHSEAP